MTYLEQIEQYVGYYPETAFASLSVTCGVTTLPAYPGSRTGQAARSHGSGSSVRQAY